MWLVQMVWKCGPHTHNSNPLCSLFACQKYKFAFAIFKNEPCDCSYVHMNVNKW